MKPTPSRRRSAPPILAPLAALALAVLSAPALAAGHPLPLWRVSDGRGHSLYLAGSMHALTAADYPLPRAFAAAFDRSRRLVEELDLNTISPEQIHGAIQASATLPAGTTLAAVMGTAWPRAQALAAKSGIDLAPYDSRKPWFAALGIAENRFFAAGYRPGLGLDRHFANLAAKRKMPVVGLETLTGQMGFLDAMDPALQRQFLVQTLAQASGIKTELAALHRAWRTGDTAALAALADKDFARHPRLRRQLLDARNRSWLPRLKRCLAADQGCFVVVGAEHMSGPAGLLALLRKAGYHVVQLHGTSTPAPATTAAGE